VQSAVLVSINATVPGDLVTDLQRAGKIQDPLASNNHLLASQVQYWNGNTYTYRKSFRPAPGVAGAASVRLIFNSVKMGSTISLNGADGNVLRRLFRAIFTFKQSEHLP
jgi:hypothetical protein